MLSVTISRLMTLTNQLRGFPDDFIQSSMYNFSSCDIHRNVFAIILLCRSRPTSQMTTCWVSQSVGWWPWQTNSGDSPMISSSHPCTTSLCVIFIEMSLQSFWFAGHDPLHRWLHAKFCNQQADDPDKPTQGIPRWLHPVIHVQLRFMCDIHRNCLCNHFGL